MTLGPNRAAMGSLSDRYDVLGVLANGGMASVLYGRLKAPAGFAREVAIKRLHPHFARETQFVSMFIDEARICARLSHANIVSALDVIDTPPDLCLVMEYVPGAGLDALLHASRARGLAVPIPIAVGLLAGVLHGLHAAHEARNERGEQLNIVHRDVSPSNILVGEDGVARVLDFGIAKAVSKLRTTPSGEIKGKFAYMAPEQLRGEATDRRFDVYSAAVVLWEVLVGRSLFGGTSRVSVMRDVLERVVAAPSRERAGISSALDAIVLRGLAREPAQRFASAHDFALALERSCDVAAQSELSAWVRALVGDVLQHRAAELRRLRREAASGPTPVAMPRRHDQNARPIPIRTHAEAAPRPGGSGTATSATRRSRSSSIVRCSALLVLAAVLRADATPWYGALTPSPARRVASPVSGIAADAWSGTAQTSLVDRPSDAARAPTGSTPASAPFSDLSERRTVPLLERATPATAPKPSRRASTARRHAAPAPVLPAVASPARPAQGVDGDCAQAFRLEIVDGVVIKTFKPACLK